MNDDIKSKFATARKYFPHTKNVTYLNSASYCPFSTLVTDAIKNNMDIRLEGEVDDSHDAFVMRNDLRQDFASMIGADQSDIGLGMNTSFGLNVAAYGLPLKEGDDILVSDIEFPSVVYSFKAAAEQLKLNLKFIKSKNKFFDIDEFKKSITPKTKVLAISFVQFFNGYKNDLETIGEICRKHNFFFVVDGIQGMGTVPIDVKKLGIDLFSSGCQKWMLAPQGCGFFYISEKIRNSLKNPFSNWLSVDWEVQFTDLFRYDLPYFKSSERFELGYYGVLNLIGMKASNQLFKSIGIDNIQKHNHNLINLLADYIENSSYYSITSSMDEKHRSSIFTFKCKDLEGCHNYLLENKIMCVRREGSIRISVHLFNDQSDIDKLINTLALFAQEL